MGFTTCNYIHASTHNASYYGRNKVELKTKNIIFQLILTLKSSIGKWGNADNFTSKPFKQSRSFVIGRHSA